jgi:hypothetical protein
MSAYTGVWVIFFIRWHTLVRYAIVWQGLNRIIRYCWCNMLVGLNTTLAAWCWKMLDQVRLCSESSTNIANIVLLRLRVCKVFKSNHALVNMKFQMSIKKKCLLNGVSVNYQFGCITACRKNIVYIWHTGSQHSLHPHNIISFAQISHSIN